MALLSKLFGRRKTGEAERPALLTRDQFADRYAVMLRDQAPELSAERVEGNVHLCWPDGGTMNQFLDNAYSQYRGDPGALEQVLEAQLASARAAASPQRSLDLTLVLPLIKSRSWLNTAIAQAGGKVAFATRPLVSDLIVVFAQDLPSSIAYVQFTDLEGICDEAALFSHAVANLGARVPDLKAIGSDGRYRIALDGFFDTSLLLIAGDWIGSLELAGAPVFALPSRDQLMVCGSDDADAVAELAEIAPQIAADSAYDISGQLITLRSGILQPFTR